MSVAFQPPAPSRKAQALAFIEDYLSRTGGRSPAMGDIARALGVGMTRAKALVHELAKDRSIIREPGAQRAISVPGLTQRMAIEAAKAALRADGWTVDDDVRRVDGPEPCPQGHLPIVAVIRHIAEPEADEGGDGDDGGCTGTRAAAGKAPGAGEAAPETDRPGQA